MAYTLIHRTGLSRGRVYNTVGENLTEDAPGAGNLTVGPWARDYSSLMGTNSVNYDTEFSGIIIDGRAMSTGGDGDDGILYPDLDEDEDLSDRGSVVGRDTQSAAIHSCHLRLYHTAPDWTDAFVWRVDKETGTPSQIGPLADWLEAEAVSDIGWHPIRHALRVPVYWALYKCPVGPNYEGLAQMIAENSANVVGQLGQLAWGPLGMLTALHGAVYASQHAVRLYEPTTSIVPVERGMFDMPYDSATEDDLRDPDYVFSGDIEAGTQGLSILDSPAQRARGRIYTTSIASKRDVRAKPGEVYVWHWQTAPVRVAKLTAGAMNPDDHIVIGASTSAFQGPFCHLVYHELTARYRAR